MPGGFGNIQPSDGKQFSSTYQPARQGRKPRVFSQIATEFKELGLERATPEIVAEAYEYLLALPLSEVIEIAGKPREENDLPSIYRLVAKEMIGKRGQEMIKEMLDRAHGKAKTKVDVTSDGQSISPLSTLPAEKQAEVLRILSNADNDK